MNWHKYFLDICDVVAKKSKDKHTKFGAVIIGPGMEIRSTGYNGFCRKANDDTTSVPERFERPEKYLWFEHAERNAIYNAARSGVSTLDCSLYVQSMPCMDCARAIVQSGIKEIFLSEKVLKQRLDMLKKENRTAEIENYKKVMILFHEAEVTVWLLNFMGEVGFQEQINKDDFLIICNNDKR